jgi:hypothetical protein
MDVVRPPPRLTWRARSKPLEPGKGGLPAQQGATDVAAVAVALPGGGGHRLAAGSPATDGSQVLDAVRLELSRGLRDSTSADPVSALRRPLRW